MKLHSYDFLVISLVSGFLVNTELCWCIHILRHNAKVYSVINPKNLYLSCFLIKA
jgi:hypothetical protein